MSSINETKSNIEIALFEFLKKKTDKSEEEIMKLSKKFLEQIAVSYTHLRAHET